MTFDKFFFEDEVREGFYVSGIMKRSWAAQMEVLDEIDKVCQKYGIKWFADCGTLLGAVRHGGVIPWDDDFDICMFREDYEVFLQIAKAELPEDYLVRNMYTEDDYYEYTTRIVNGKHFCVEDDFLRKYHDFPFIVGIDIFVLDHIYQDESKENWRLEVARKIQTLIDDIAECRISEKQLKKQVITLEKVCNYHITDEKNLIISLYRMLDFLFASSKKENNGDVALMPYWVEERSHRYPKSCFNYQVNLPFEENYVPVPIGYNQVLEIMYGDFIKVSKQGGIHDYPMFKQQEELLNKKLGRKLCGYSFEVADLESNRLFSKNDLKNYLVQGMDELKINNTKILELCSQNFGSNLLERLEESQKSAITLGEAIEQLSGDGTETVKLLEGYCEALYNLYNAIIGNEEVLLKQEYKKLEQIVLEIAKSLDEELLFKKEILFIPYKANAWQFLKPVWEKAVADEKARVIVMPIPYYEKDILGNLREMREEFAQYPEEIETVDYRTYNIELRHPDVIVIQNPYDECNYVTSIPPEYYSSKLKNMTDQLIYVPYFEVDEIQTGEEKGIQSMEYFVTVPGVVHSDIVVVQSEQMKHRYIQKLVEMAGESTRDLWEHKLVVGKNTSLNNKVYKLKEKEKKTLAYYVSASVLYQYTELAIEKYKSVLQEFTKHKENLSIIWYVDEAIDCVLKEKEPEVYYKFQKIIDLFYQLGLGERVKYADNEESLLICDGYYGDVSRLVRICSRNKIPVMIQKII